MQVGFKALADRYGIALAQPLRVESVIGTTRKSRESNGHVENTYPASYQPEDDFAGHFGFGLKYEEIHLEFFARLFTVVGPEHIEAWCRQAPFGQYARRTGFLYETVQQALQFDLDAALRELNQTFGADILMRTASWLTLKESRASFLIEKESDKGDRIQRFAQVIAKYCGHIEDPLSNDSLHTLQAGILGHEAVGLGLRRSPVFVGQATMREDIVHYIAPPFEALAQLLDGLKAFELATRGAEPLARAAALAFAFVYIHPMRDGNGRIHRFLNNDTLIRDKTVPDGVILPVSATITSSIDFRARYDRTLEVFSRPFMQRYAASYRFGELVVYEDGTSSNLVFDEYDDAQFAWRYPDLTEHVLYTAQVVAHTVRTEMADEARVLVIFQRAQERLKEVMEMPDQDATRIIRSLKENGWQVSGKLKKAYPQLEDTHRAERVVEAVRCAFEER